MTEPWPGPWLSCDLALIVVIELWPRRDLTVTELWPSLAVIIGPRSRGHSELTVTIYFLIGCFVSSKSDLCSTFDTICYIYSVRCHYNAVNFHPNPHKRHPIAHPWGRGMGYLLWKLLLMHILPQSLLHHMQNHVMLDRAITALNCKQYHDMTDCHNKI